MHKSAASSKINSTSLNRPGRAHSCLPLHNSRQTEGHKAQLQLNGGFESSPERINQKFIQRIRCYSDN